MKKGVSKKRRYRLGEMMVDEEIITREQLEKALEEQTKTGEKLGKLLIRLGLIDEETLLDFLSRQLNIPKVRLLGIEDIPRDVLSTVPDFLVRRHKLIPIAKEKDSITIAMCDPLDIFALDDVSLVVGDLKVNPVIATELEVNMAIERFYGAELDLKIALEKMGIKLIEPEEEKIDITKVASEAEEAPIINLVNYILLKGITSGASDIHIEPYERGIRIRNRIDGMLYDMPAPPKSFHPAIVSRIKIMGKADIAEQRLPQEARAKVMVENREIDLRISFTPTTFGERVAIRILDPKALTLDLNKLGFEEDDLKIYSECIRRPNGIILVCGPTGSGKTTTLYSTLYTINSPEKNIMTVENPVEYILPGISQQQVRPEIGLEFATGLRSILRQDPDVIMVGEIRDRETAEVAVNAALTGHLVFSTLHTNDAPSAVVRMESMGITPFLISSSLIMVVAQRLIRTLCPECKEPQKVSRSTLVDLGLKIAPREEKLNLFRPVGCRFCLNTGYRGRTGIFEVMPIDKEIQQLIAKGRNVSEIREVACKKGMKLLAQSGMKKLLDGITSLEEVLRVV